MSINPTTVATFVASLYMAFIGCNIGDIRIYAIVRDLNPSYQSRRWSHMDVVYTMTTCGSSANWECVDCLLRPAKLDVNLLTPF